MDAASFLDRLQGLPFYRGQIVFCRRFPPRRGGSAGLESLSPWGREACAALGISRLHAHQLGELEAVRSGQDVVLNSGSAAGKSLSFLIAAVEAALGEPPGATLIVCPLKPVERAQREKFELIAARLAGLRSAVTVYDGDLSSHGRRAARERLILITNPDMLHQGILPNHSRWAGFFSRLRLVVVEELHAYSGLFGANVANLFRRLWRVCRHYGATPQLIGTSSTLSNPGEHAGRLCGRQVRVLDRDDAPRGAVTHVFWKPAAEVPSVEAGMLLGELVAAGCGAIAFSRARVACELAAQYARQHLEEAGGPADAVLTYRGGYLPEEHRAAEARMHGGRPIGISATNLLELGLDLPALDAALICGWPGSVASYFQQAARAGRAGQESLVFYVGLHDPVNGFLQANPQYVFERPFEPGVVERGNPHVLAGHLRCAVQELPVSAQEAADFGPNAQEVLATLQDRRKVLQKDGTWYSATSERAAREMPLRGYFDRNVVIEEQGTGKVVAEVDWLGAHSVVHPRAIYVHEGRQYLVRDFDRSKRRAYVEPVSVDYYTNPLGHSFVHSVDACLRQRPLPGGTAFFGEVTAGAVTEGFEERRCRTNELVRSVPIELPPVKYQTMGLWICLSQEREAEFAVLGLSPELYGLGNALRIVLPLFMTCDVLDLRPWPGQTNFSWPALYFYERYPRGLGFTERAFDVLDDILAAAARNLSGCQCANGCPRCVGDPVRPFLVNNPELEADLIPPRADVELVIATLRERRPMEELLSAFCGERKARRIVAGREQLLQSRRAEAACAPPRSLPADAPAGTGQARRALPLQLERGVRRRVEKMRTADLEAPVKRVRDARIPAPEKEGTLAQPDAAMRRRHRAEAERAGLPSELPAEPPAQEAGRRKVARPADAEAPQMAAEAVRRARERHRTGKVRPEGE
jgi:DEAD/DEAH box helicase domain-containing protein